MHFFVGLTFWDVNLPATRQVHSKDRIHMFIMPSMLSVKSMLLSWATITDFSCPFVRYAVTHRSSNHLLSRYSILFCSDFDLVGGIGKLLVGVKEALLLHTRGGVQQQGLQQDLGAPPPLSSSTSSGRTLLGYRRDNRYFYNTRSPSKNLLVHGQSTFICKSKFKHFSFTTIIRRGSISMSNLLPYEVPSHVLRHCDTFADYRCCSMTFFNYSKGYIFCDIYLSRLVEKGVELRGGGKVVEILVYFFSWSKACFFFFL